MLMLLGRGAERMRQQLEKIYELTMQTNQAVNLLTQRHEQTEGRVDKLEAHAERSKETQQKHQTEIEKLNSYSASHQKAIKELEMRQGNVIAEQQSQRPFWGFLSRVVDKLATVAAGGIVAAIVALFASGNL